MRKRMVEPITLPKNTVESTASHFWIDADGVIMIVNKPKAIHSLEDAIENIAITRKLSESIPRCILIDMTQTKSMTREAREAYAKEGSSGKIKAIALLTKSSMGRIVANFFLSFNKPGAPTKLFNSSTSAKKWLAEF